MNTEEIIKTLYAYLENMRKINACSEELKSLEAYDEWAEKYKELCAKQYDITALNNNCFEILEPLWGRTISDDDLANRLYEFVEEMDSQQNHDYILLSRLLDLLIPFFSKKDDKEKLVFLYFLAIRTSYEQAWNLSENQNYQADVNELIKLTKCYSEIASKKARTIMVRVWYIYIVIEYEDGLYDSVSEMFRRYDEFLEFLEANRLDSSNDETVSYESKHIPQMMMCVERHLGLEEDLAVVDRFIEMANENYITALNDTDEEWKIEPVVYAAKLHSMQKNGLFAKEDICDTMLAFYRQILSNCGEIRSHDEYARKAVSAQWILFHWLTDEFTEEESLSDGYRKYAMHELISESDMLYTQKLEDYYVKLSSSVEAWCETILPFASTDSERIRIIHDYAFKYQKITYIRSIVIAEISKLIAQKIVDEKKEIIEKIIPHIEGDFVESIYQAAYLHDAGKIRIRYLANLLGRAYSKEELNTLHYHSLRGAQILCNWENPGLLINVSQGHHKSYDNLSGYPESVTTEGSPYKIAVDIVHIADAIDTATSFWGKKDAQGKSFDTIMHELRLGAGTQYNPDVVSLIVNSPDLMKKIKHLVVYARCEEIYKAYQG